MDIYFYKEKNECINTGKPLKFGTCREYIDMASGGCCAVAVGGNVGDFSGSAICLGDFDGVHRGHRALFEAAAKYPKWGVMLFDRSIKEAPRLTVQTEKLRLIEECGADYAVIVEFDEKFSKKSTAEFADFLKNDLKVSAAVAGYDYRFAKGAAGGKDELSALCAERKIKTEIIESVSADGAPVKSTKIRELVACGDIESANRLLGYAYIISGKVEKGLQNGRKLGFPTANIEYDCEKLLPPDGVYRGYADGFDAVVNIGKNPTFDASERTAEVHLIGFDGDLYGKSISVGLFEKIRDDIKFNNINELTEQIKSDVAYVKGRKDYGKENFNRNDL